MSTRFSGGGVVADSFRDLEKPMPFSGGGVVAEIFRDLKKPIAIQWGGSSRKFPWSPKAYAIRLGGGSSAEFVFSVTSKRHFPLMGPFYIFLLSRRGGPGPLGPPP